MRMQSIHCLSVDHALKEVNVNFHSLKFLLELLHIISLFFIVVRTEHLIYNSLCLFIHSLSLIFFGALLLIDKDFLVLAFRT